jgi:hypothetical protein
MRPPSSASSEVVSPEPHSRWRPIVPYLIVFCASVLAMFAVEALLVFLGSRLGVIFPVDIWGDFASWLAGILPALAILFSVHMWLEDRRAQDLERQARGFEWGRASAKLLTVTRRPGGRHVFYNNSIDAVEVLVGRQWDPVQPKGHLELVDTAEVVVRLIDGSVWRVDTSREPLSVSLRNQSS